MREDPLKLLELKFRHGLVAAQLMNHQRVGIVLEIALDLQLVVLKVLTNIRLNAINDPRNRIIKMSNDITSASTSYDKSNEATQLLADASISRRFASSRICPSKTSSIRGSLSLTWGMVVTFCKQAAIEISRDL